MKTCEDHVGCVVVYNGTMWNNMKCPLCEAQKKIEELEQEVSTLEEQSEDESK